MSRISSNACTQQQSSERSRQLLPNWGTSISTPFLPPWLQPPHEMPSPLLIPMSMARKETRRENNTGSIEEL